MSNAEVIENMPSHEYAMRPGLRAGFLTAVDSSTPGKAKFDAKQSVDSPVLKLGRAIHSMILEPDLFAQSYICGGSPVNPKTNKPFGIDSQKYMEWEATQNKPFISSEEHRRLLGMSEAVNNHKLARTIRDMPRKTELSIFWTRPDGTKCKARLDCFQDGIIWDLKSTADASYRSYQRSVLDYRYHMQAAWFIEGAGYAGLVDPKSCVFRWLAVESVAPYQLAVYQASPELLQVGWGRCDNTVDLINQCQKENNWPTAYAEEVILMDCPGWMKPQES